MLLKKSTRGLASFSMSRSDIDLTKSAFVEVSIGPPQEYPLSLRLTHQELLLLQQLSTSDNHKNEVVVLRVTATDDKQADISADLARILSVISNTGICQEIVIVSK